MKIVYWEELYKIDYPGEVNQRLFQQSRRSLLVDTCRIDGKRVEIGEIKTIVSGKQSTFFLEFFRKKMLSRIFENSKITVLPLVIHISSQLATSTGTANIVQMGKTPTYFWWWFSHLKFMTPSPTMKRTPL